MSHRIAYSSFCLDDLKYSKKKKQEKSLDKVLSSQEIEKSNDESVALATYWHKFITKKNSQTSSFLDKENTSIYDLSQMLANQNSISNLPPIEKEVKNSLDFGDEIYDVDVLKGD